jgi:hypothetical protein
MIPVLSRIEFLLLAAVQSGECAAMAAQCLTNDLFQPDYSFAAFKGRKWLTLKVYLAVTLLQPHLVCACCAVLLSDSTV